jgi:hypothetical protein
MAFFMYRLHGTKNRSVLLAGIVPSVSLTLSTIIITAKYSSQPDPTNACTNTMRSARIDVEQEEDEKEENSLTRTTTTTTTTATRRLNPHCLDPCINIQGQIVSKHFTGYSLYRELESDSIC